MLQDQTTLRPRYNEVDQMGYVYHANYVAYCHQARTEMMRKYGINDKWLEDHQIMMPVIEMNLKYHKPSGYDELLTITTTIKELPVVRFRFNFEFRNQKKELVCRATSTVVFVDSETRKPMKVPKVVEDALKEQLK
ncbi:MAG TPA: thioesterase family protein [Marinilabiliaceae bacterium]|nr:thioesterase family protein [Marinilabiliaceae bacterium]